MDATFKKRAGTSGISGQLFKTKLISLILFRLLHEDEVQEFNLASNMDDLGGFDDICFRIKLSGRDEELLVFIQVKHKDDKDSYLSYDLIQKFNATFVKVRENFSSSKDVFFKGKFDETECLFVLYTNAKYFDDSSNVELERADSSTSVSKQARIPFKGPYSDMLNNLLATGDETIQGCQANYTDNDANKMNLEKELATLAELFAKFLVNKADQSMNIMLDKYILRYHVILAKSVVNISEVKSEEKNPVPWRNLTFRTKFFDTDDKNLTILRNNIYEQVVKTITPFDKSQVKKKKKGKIKQKGDDGDSCTSSVLNSEESIIDKLISMFLSEPSDLTLRPLLGTHIIYTTDNLKFTVERPDDDIKKLEQIDIPKIPEAEIISARNILSSLKLKVPVTFGNIDLTIGGNDKKVEKRLNTLTDFIEGLCQKSQSNNSFVVSIDESVGDGYLSPNGGVGGAVGNVLVYDKITKLLKFTDNSTHLKNNAKALFDKLFNKIDNFFLYRFDVKSLVTFPRLVFDSTEEANIILNKVLIYEKQSNHNEVEDILKNEMENHQRTNGPYNFPVKSDIMIIHYHDEILKWWMTPKSERYLTKSKDNNIYQQVINNVLAEPQITALQTTFIMNSMQYFGYDFCETATESLTSLEEYSSNIIVTDISKLTTMKVIQCLRNKYHRRYAVLDLENILNLIVEDYSTLITEIRGTTKVLIVVCDNPKDGKTLYERLKKLVEVTINKKIIVITDNLFVEMAQEYFPDANIICNHNQSLVDLTPKAQSDILKNAHVIFQGQKVSLDLLVDDASIAFIKGVVLNKIFNKETVMLGNSLSNSNFEKIEHLYVNRKVSQSLNDTNNLLNDNIVEDKSNDNVHLVKSFHDIKNDVVLIIGAPEIGKSTLLTYLSLRTKQLDGKLWIVRINLLDYSKTFHNWRVHKTKLNTLEIMKFMCQVILKNETIPIRLRKIDTKVYLNGCTDDEWISFELKMFLHTYNEGNLLFLFDGFDEICPLYKNRVIALLKLTVTRLRKHKVWVTTRPYSEILPDLEEILGKSYKLEFIDDTERNRYLKKYWAVKLKIENLSDSQIGTVRSFIDFIISTKDRTFDKIVYLFFEYLYSYFPHINMNPKVMFPYEDYRNSNLKQQDDQIMGTPVLLHLYADYFINLIRVGNNVDNWNFHLQYGILTVYETFIETKLRNLYQDKNKLDVYKADIRRRYKKDYTDCVTKYKNVAAYCLIFQKVHLDELKDIDPFNEKLNEFEALVNEMKTGTDRTGLISHIAIDNVPVFVYRTFAEYFTAEFVCDVFKNNKFEFNQKSLLYTISLMTFDIISWINKKRKKDNELDRIVKDMEDKRFAVVNTRANLFTEWSVEQIIRFRSSSQEDYETDCFSEYNDKMVATLNWLEPKERQMQIAKIQKTIITKMKPHLKKYFDIY